MKVTKGFMCPPVMGIMAMREDEEVDENGERDEKPRCQDVRVEKDNDVTDNRK